MVTCMELVIKGAKEANDDFYDMQFFQVPPCQLTVCTGVHSTVRCWHVYWFDDYMYIHMCSVNAHCLPLRLYMLETWSLLCREHALMSNPKP